MRTFLTILAMVLPLMSLSPSAYAEPVPRVAIITQNAGTEITDLLVPFAVLSDAGVDVQVVATSEGPVTLWPEFEMVELPTIAEIEPDEFDLLIVPAVLNADDPLLQQFVKDFASRGGLTASICDGVNVLAIAGLLDGRDATGHFYSHKKRSKDFPQVNWIQDQRYIQDDRIISTAGVSASAPVSIYLLQRLLGEAAAADAVARFGIDANPEHSVDQFSFGLGDGLTMLGNGARGLRKKNYGLLPAPGVDEYSLAFLADILARTSRVRLGFAGQTDIIETRHGLKLKGTSLGDIDTLVALPAQSATSARGKNPDLLISSSAKAVDQLVTHVREEFGSRTARFVTKQLEMPWQFAE